MKYSFKKFFFAASIFLFLFDFSSCVIEPRPCKITYKSSYGNPPKTKKIPKRTNPNILKAKDIVFFISAFSLYHLDYKTL